STPSARPATPARSTASSTGSAHPDHPRVIRGPSERRRTAMAPDYDQLLWEQMHALADLAAQLGPDDWDHPSLCEGWRVRDVYGHMCVGHTYPLPKLLAKVAANGFDVDKGSA